MQGTIYVVKLGNDIMPHFRLWGETYVAQPGVEIIFQISGEGSPEDLLTILSIRTMREARRRGLKINPLDFD